MKAATFTNIGNPQVIQYKEVPDPIPGPAEILIQTEAIGLNFADIYRRQGHYATEPPSPYILGYKAAGTVVELGTNVENFSVGDRVAFAHVPRANVELVTAPAWKVVPLPEEISFATSAGLLLQGLTAHYFTHDSFLLRSGQTALIHSASGGVGLLLLQICRRRGVRTIGTVSTESKLRLAEAAGADHVLVRKGHWREQVTEITKSEGVDVSYDGIGTTLLASISLTKPHGTTVYFGQSGGTPPSVDPNLLMNDSKVLVGGELWSHLSSEEALRGRSKSLFHWIAEGALTLKKVTPYPLARTAEAHEALESGTTEGKILLMPRN